MSGPRYVAGDFWRICEVCGFRYRSTQTLRRWDGLMVCREDWETRHGQDFVRGRKDLQNVPDPRPESIDNLIGSLTTTLTADVSASATTLNVASSVRFVNSDRIGIICANGETISRTVNLVPDGTSITITSALGTTALSGALVVNYSAVSQPDIG